MNRLQKHEREGESHGQIWTEPGRQPFACGQKMQSKRRRHPESKRPFEGVAGEQDQRSHNDDEQGRERRP